MNFKNPQYPSSLLPITLMLLANETADVEMVSVTVLKLTSDTKKLGLKSINTFANISESLSFMTKLTSGMDEQLIEVTKVRPVINSCQSTSVKVTYNCYTTYITVTKKETEND